ncbi:hypothetical protein SLE2022_148670 [Rubroshorea leprosula]
MGNWINGAWKWNLQWRRCLHSWEKQQEEELQREIQEIKITRGKPDLREWVHNNEGRYTTRTAYQILTKENSSNQQGAVLHKAWNVFIPSEIAAFSWQVLQDKIPTKLNLLKRGIIRDIGECKCVFCGVALEDTSHLFIHCKVAYSIWNACFKWWGVKTALDRDCGKVLEQHPNLIKTKGEKKGWECIWFSIVWSIWLARNEKVFRGKDADRDRIVELVQLRAFNWIKCKGGGGFFSLADWFHNPAGCLEMSYGNRKSMNSEKWRNCKRGQKSDTGVVSTPKFDT